MLWYKAWLDTRWRFLVGLGLLTCGAAATVLTYPQVMGLLGIAPNFNGSGELAEKVREGVELVRTYPGFVWSQWFSKTPTQAGILFAVLLGCGGLLSHGARGTLFTLSLPASRNQVLGTRAVAGLAEIAALAFIPSLMIPLFSPAVGETYSLASALLNGVCLFAGMTVFFSLAVLLSTVFTDVWSPLVLSLLIACAFGMSESLFPTFKSVGLFRVIDGETFFRSGHMPWLGLALIGLLSTALMYGAALNFARRDF